MDPLISLGNIYLEVVQRCLYYVCLVLVLVFYSFKASNTILDQFTYLQGNETKISIK